MGSILGWLVDKAQGTKILSSLDTSPIFSSTNKTLIGWSNTSNISRQPVVILKEDDLSTSQTISIICVPFSFFTVVYLYTINRSGVASTGKGAKNNHFAWFSRYYCNIYGHLCLQKRIKNLLKVSLANNYLDKCCENIHKKYVFCKTYRF